MNKVLFLNKFAPHYRKGIFVAMDRELGVDFYFGDKKPGVKKLDYSYLHNFKKELKNIYITKSVYYQQGAIGLLFKPYKKYIIMGDMGSISVWIILLLSKLTRKEVYLWAIGWFGYESKLKKVFKRIFFGLADSVFLYGDYARKSMIEYGFNADKLYVLYNSLDYDSQLVIRNQLQKNDVYIRQFHNTNPNIIFIGTLLIRKKLGLLINAVARLKSENFFVNVTILGDGVDRDHLKSMVNEYDLNDTFFFYGACYDEKIIADYIFNADVGVSPGICGLTTMHMFAYGTPVITHNNMVKQGPESEAIIPEETGALFQENDVDSLAETIKIWLTKFSDKREIVRQNCYKIIDEKYNPHQQIKIMKHTMNIKQ
ncbi:MAG: glycosyltransferase family 4 protein [Prolixibacteraceae bacterium]|nr:glycosyltransferase family 4 protein [Prolixibacteraceae bacterium]